MESTSEFPPGICQRLINFILRTVRRPSALPVSTTQVPVESRSPAIPNGASMHAEIQVDFRHTEILDTKKDDDDGLVVITRDLPNGSDRKGKGAKKTVSFMDSSKKGDESGGDDNETKPRRHWPLLSVESNINEKSDAYISSRKKAMGGNYTLDQENHGQ